MRTVRDDEGDTYLLEKRSGETSLVRDPETGERRYVENDTIEPAGEDPLAVAARGVPAELRRVCRVVHDDAILGLLLDLDERGPTAIRDLLGRYERCESDLNGLLAELVAAGVLAETEVAGERGYRVTEGTSDALAVLRGEDE